MKRWFCILLSLIVCLSLAGCGQKLPENDVPQESINHPTALPPAAQPPLAEAPAPSAPPAEVPENAPSQQPVEAPETPEAPDVVPDGNIIITQNANGDTVFQLDVSLPGCEDLPKIDSYYKTMYEDLERTYALLHEDATRQQAEYQAMGLEFMPWQATVQYEIVRNDGTTLSILREIYEHFGGAHPTITYQSETFDLATQGRLLLGNLFTVPEDVYLPRLQDMILAQMDKRETEEGIYYYETAREQLSNLLEPMNFALTEDSLLLFFDPYALAPYAAGPQHFYLALSDLADIVKPQYLTE